MRTDELPLSALLSLSLPYIRSLLLAGLLDPYSALTSIYSGLYPDSDRDLSLLIAFYQPASSFPRFLFTYALGILALRNRLRQDRHVDLLSYYSSISARNSRSRPSTYSFVKALP